MTPAELSAFAAVARYGGFRAAARALGTSPSALSHSVAGLEARLHVQLFIRTTRNVSLTDVGKRFSDALSPALAQLEQAVRVLSEYNDRPSGLIRINAASAAAEQILAPVIVQFLKANQDMRIEIVSEGELVDIARGGFDCGIRAKALVPDTMVAVPIGPDLQHIVVASPDYLYDAPPLNSPADLARHLCIQLRLPSGRHYRWEFERHGDVIVVDTQGRLELDNSRLIGIAAQSGFGIGYVSRAVVEADLARGTLVQLLADWTPPYPGLCLYYPRHQHQSAGMRALVAFIRQNLRL
ncbi:MAG: LysR family transcriptional regulator [Bradyrhizobium sp.]